ncbi:MAG: RlmE family RNA methyltransferase [Bdellovibrio sp.]|nr:RlmE family RNA methyltransferase [Bdellovibrio sp.]
MNYIKKDYYYKKAKNENFAARSIYKLQEIDQRFKTIKPDNQVLDLGSAPGSWAQYCSQKIGHRGKLLGIDLEKVHLSFPNAVFIQGDLRELVGEEFTNFELLLKKESFLPNFDTVLSDMAPKTTGIKITDQARSLELCELAFAIAVHFLKDGGHFVCKLFHSGEFDNFKNQLKKSFKQVEILRPKSTRKESKEIYFIALGRVTK